MRLATLPYTRDLFELVSDLAIIFVYVALEHAIREYKTGRQVLAKFESNNVSRKFRYLVIMNV